MFPKLESGFSPKSAYLDEKFLTRRFPNNFLTAQNLRRAEEASCPFALFATSPLETVACCSGFSKFFSISEKLRYACAVSCAEFHFVHKVGLVPFSTKAFLRRPCL